MGHGDGRGAHAGVSVTDRLPFVALLGGLLVVAPALLWLARDQWFFLDEWDFLVDRDAGDVESLFMSHNGHWSTVPILIYRAQFRLWGLTSYVPYQLTVVVLHLGVVVLLWTLMRRIGVRGWIATPIALVFSVLGSGSDNIVWAFQIGFTGSLLCGLAHLLLADHDGRSDIRDVLGVGIGLVGLMSSAVAVPLVAGTGAALLLRRGWRAAALHTVPLASAFAVWYVAIGHEGGTGYVASTNIASFVVEMAEASFSGVGQLPAVGFGLFALAATGFGLAAARARGLRSAAPLAVPVALLLAFALFASLTAAARAAFDDPEAERYVYVASALLLPLVGLGAEAASGRWRAFGFASVALVMVGVPGNVDALAHRNPYTRGDRALVTAVAHSPLLGGVPADVRIAPSFRPDLGPTAAWLRAAVRRGDLPDWDAVELPARLAADGRLAFGQDATPYSAAGCPTRSEPVRRKLRAGDAVLFTGVVEVVVVRGDARSWPLRFDGGTGGSIVARSGPIDVVVNPVDGALVIGSARCDPARAPIQREGERLDRY